MAATTWGGRRRAGVRECSETTVINPVREGCPPPLGQSIMRVMFRRTPPPTVDGWNEGTETLDDVTVLPTSGCTPGHIVALWIRHPHRTTV